MRTRRRSTSVNRTLCLIGLILALAGCSTVSGHQGESNQEVIPAERPVSEVVKPDVQYPVDVYDPFEGFNRGVYMFNAKFDEYIFLPVVDGYRFITPDYVEDRVSDFFSNVSDIQNFINAFLQLKFSTSFNTLSRFVLNTTIGIGGLWDQATRMGLSQQTEDFGQTLGRYGVGNGPYLVLPFFGPSNARDGTGLLVDFAARYFYLYVPLNLDDSPEITTPITALNLVDTRHQVEFRYYETGSPFEYELVRFLYTKVRRLEIER